MKTIAGMLCVLALAAPSIGAAKEPPTAGWARAGELAGKGEAAEALALLREAITNVEALGAEATVDGPHGGKVGRAEALHRLHLEAGDVAAGIAWAEALLHYEKAYIHASDAEARKIARRKRDAARANLEAGQTKAPSFLADDLDAIEVPEKKAAVPDLRPTGGWESELKFTESEEK